MADKVKAAAQATNLTPETFLEHYRLVYKAKQLLDEQNGFYRATLKAAKSAGINQGMLIEAMRLKKQEPEDIAMGFRDLGRYMSWLGQPIGTQVDMFGATDDQSPKQKAADEHTAWEAEQQGHAWGSSGGAICECPHPPGTELFVSWRDGWSQAQEALAGGKTPQPKKAGGKRARTGNPEDRASP